MDLMGSVSTVLKIGLHIEELVETAQQNKKDCEKIANRVECVRATVESLNNTDICSQEFMIKALKQLEKTFLEALELVKACQTKNSVWLFIRAGNVSKQLSDVRTDITDKIQNVILANGVQLQNVITKAYIIHKDPAKPEVSILAASKDSPGEEARGRLEAKERRSQQEAGNRLDLVGSVTQVVKIALQIQELAGTVQQNKDDCKKIAIRVERLRAIVESFENTDVSREKIMIDTLSELEETLLRVLKLVKACQTKNRVWLFLRAGNVSKQLREVKDEIREHIEIADFCNGVQQTIILTRGYIRDPAAKPKKLLKVLSMQGEQEIHVVASRSGEVEGEHASYPTDVTRSEIHGETESFPAGSLEDTISHFRNFSASELKAVTKHVIGEGGSAIVYKGVLTNGAEVAIKSFCVDDSQDEHVMRYAEVFSVIREHENVVRFLGYCHETKIQMVPIEGKCAAFKSRHMFVVEEYMPNGSLSDIIDGSSRQLDWTSAFRIIRGVAQGVAHIHSRGAVHLDLKPANILLDSDMNPKICDFERSRILNQNNEDVTERVMKDMAGTLAYLPPEYIADGIVSFKNDVFSFGILLLQTIRTSGLRQDSTDLDDVDSLLGPSLHDESELKERKRCMDIGMQCAVKERTDRPTIWEVIDMLDGKEQPQKPPMRNKAASFKKKGGA